MNREQLKSYSELKDEDGKKVFFRKFNSGTWIVLLDENDNLIGRVRISDNNMKIIENAPYIQKGDGKTKQIN